MAGSPTYTAQTDLSSSFENVQLSGKLSISGGSASVSVSILNLILN